MISPKAIEAILRLKVFGGELSFKDLLKDIASPLPTKGFNKEVVEKAERDLKESLKNGNTATKI